MTLTPQPLTVFKKLSPKGLNTHHTFLLNRIHDYNLGCSKHGQFAYLCDDFQPLKHVDGELITDNQLKCLLRRDYLENFDQEDKLSGKKLERAIEWLLRRAKEAAANCIAKPEHHGVTVLARVH